jgi:hypothetical protein
MMRCTAAGRAQGVQHPQRQQGGRNAARAQQAHHAPGHQALAGQADGAAHLGESGKQQVGADGQWGLTPKKKMRIGVISEPPPTPVRPTISPPRNPQRQTPNHAWRRM